MILISILCNGCQGSERTQLIPAGTLCVATRLCVGDTWCMTPIGSLHGYGIISLSTSFCLYTQISNQLLTLLAALSLKLFLCPA